MSSKVVVNTIPSVTYHLLGIATDKEFHGSPAVVDVFVDELGCDEVFYVGKILSAEHGIPVTACLHDISDELCINVANEISKYAGFAVTPDELRTYVIKG